MGIKNEDGTFTDRCLDRLLPGEPFVVFRAQDESTPGVMVEWLARNRQLSEERVAGFLVELASIKIWQSKNPDLVKRAD